MSVLSPSIEMPPMTCGWCTHWHVILLFGLYAGFLWIILHSIQSFLAVFLTIIGTMMFVRLLVACAVHQSVQSSIRIYQQLLTEYEVDLVLGFSWGGAVLAELLTKSQQTLTTTLQEPFHNDNNVAMATHHQRKPTILLMAPTTSIVASLNIFRSQDAALRLKPSLDTPVTVVHATFDAVFCPHQERWQDKPGIDLCLLHDDHVLLRPSSIRRLKEIICDILQQQ
jgi:hypothetical protein